MDSTWNVNEDELQRLVWVLNAWIILFGCFDMFGMRSVRNSLKIPRWDFRVVLQWSGRNSMALVSGCTWWYPIYI